MSAPRRVLDLFDELLLVPINGQQLSFQICKSVSNQNERPVRALMVSSYEGWLRTSYTAGDFPLRRSYLLCRQNKDTSWYKKGIVILSGKCAHDSSPRGVGFF